MALTWRESDALAQQTRARLTAAVLAGIARGMGPDWEVIPPQPRQLGDMAKLVDGVLVDYPRTRFGLIASGTALVRVEAGEMAQAGRFALSGSLPDDSRVYFSDSDPGTTEITVSPDKAPEAIGREAARRLLPDYLARLTRCEVAKERHAGHVSRVRAQAARLIEASGGAYTISRDDKPTDTQITLVGRAGLPSLSVSSSGSVGFRYHDTIDAEAAEAMIKSIVGRQG